MKKFLPAVLVIGLVPLGILALGLLINYINKNGTTVSDNTELNAPNTTQEDTSLINTTNTPEEAPLPQDELLIRNFFDLITAKKISEAISMMSVKMLGEDPVQLNSAMQEYGVVFNSWDTVTVTNVKAIDKSSWPEDEHTYLVDLELKLKPSPPYQLWDEGANTRFITLILENGTWKIGSLATGY